VELLQLFETLDHGLLRLGRNTAEFKVEEASTEQLVAAITGASDNVVAERAKRRGEGADHE